MEIERDNPPAEYAGDEPAHEDPTQPPSVEREAQSEDPTDPHRGFDNPEDDEDEGDYESE